MEAVVMSITGISAYQSQSIFATSSVTPSARQATQARFSSSGGDTVTISDAAQMLALLDARGKAMQSGLEDGTVKLKMLDDPTLDATHDMVFMPQALRDRMPQLADRTMPTLADVDRQNKGLMSEAEMAYLRQGVMSAGADVAQAGQAVNAYQAAMRQAGIDPYDSEALLRLSKNPEMLQTVEDLFLQHL